MRLERFDVAAQKAFQEGQRSCMLRSTRGLLEKEIALRHWAERRRFEREGSPEGQAPA